MALQSRYDYENLINAVKDNRTPENVKALVEWLEQYDSSAWNGECYDTEIGCIYPIYTEIEEDEYEITGYEVR